MGAVFAWQHAIKEHGLGTNKRFSTTNYVQGQDTQDQLVQPPADKFLPYFIIDFSIVVSNSNTTSLAPASTVAGATTDVLDLFISRLELKDAIGGLQRTQLTNRVDIEEAERLAFNLPLYSVPAGGTNATFAGYNLPGAYPRAAPPNIPASGSSTITASLRVPFGSDQPGRGCFVVFAIPTLATVYGAGGTSSALTVTFREAYHPYASGAWSFQTVKINALNSGIQDIAPNIPENLSPYFVDFTHAGVTTTSTVSTNTFTQSLFQAPGLNRLQDNVYAIQEAAYTGYPDIANPLPNYGTVANQVTDVVPFTPHGLRPLIWNLNLVSSSTNLDLVVGQFTGKHAAIGPPDPERVTQPAKTDVAAPQITGAGPATIRNTARMGGMAAATLDWRRMRQARRSRSWFGPRRVA